MYVFLRDTFRNFCSPLGFHRQQEPCFLLREQVSESRLSDLKKEITQLEEELEQTRHVIGWAILRVRDEMVLLFEKISTIISVSNPKYFSPMGRFLRVGGCRRK